VRSSILLAMKIYTKAGDDGTTALLGGGRVAKSDRRLDCYGTIDELNAALGVAAAWVAGDAELGGMIRAIQNELFTLACHLAAPDAAGGAAAKLPALDESMINRLEMQIDAAEAELPALREFILPGGSEGAARLHFARTVCRRAERLVVCFSQDRPVAGIILTYLNRLSDWLFVQARAANRRAGVGDVVWEKA